MTDTPIPTDDPVRQLTLTGNSAPGASHVFLAGDIYTTLVSGADTAERYCLIDMQVLPRGGPAPHRHDFEEMFTLLEGELELTFRGATRTVAAPATVNIPANAPQTASATPQTGRPACCACAPRQGRTEMLG